MVQESLILGTIWYVLSRIWNALARSPLGRGFDAICRWFGRQWHASLIVGWFCSPRYRGGGEPAAPGRVRTRLCALYQGLKLDRLFEGSVFLRCFVWCALTAALTPLLPTMAVLGLTLVGYGSTALSLLHERDLRLPPMPLTLPIVLYALCYLVGTLTSVDRRGSLLIGVLTIVFILFAIVLYHAVDTRRQLDALTALLVTAGAAVSCYGILQYIFKWGYQSAAWVDEDMFSSIRFRVSATLQNPNMLGQYLILMIALGGAKLLSARDVWRRLYYFGCCAVMCLCMILTYSRGAWLGLLFAGVLFFILWQPRLLVLVPFGILALYAVLPETVISRFTSIGNLADQSTSYRVSIWLGTIRMLRDGYWLTGIGPGDAAFNKVYPFYSYDTVIAPHSHNLFLQIVCDAGIVALLVFLWLLIRYFRMLCGAMRRDADGTRKGDGALRLLRIGFISGMLGFLVQAMTDYSFYNYRVMLIFWVYLAVGTLSARRDMLETGGTQL